MKFTSVLLAGALVALSTQASAFDLMHPFWGPAKNQFASDTTYSFERINYKRYSNSYESQLAEKLLYGITDNWTVFGSIGRDWSKGGSNFPYTQATANNKTDFWTLGTSYNFINNGKHFLQGAFEYMQAKAHDKPWYGRDYKRKTAQAYTVTGTYGYNFDSVTPYVQVNYENNANMGPKNNANLGVTVAAYKKLADKVGATLGVTYDHPTSSIMKNIYTLMADTSYQITDKVTFKVFGNYLLDTKHKKHTEYGELYNTAQGQYTIGADLKVAF